MKNININKIARRIVALDASGVEKLFDKYDFQLSAMDDLQESFNSFVESLYTFEIGNKGGSNWLSKLWNRFWHGKYNPKKVEEELVTLIAGGVLAKVLKRIAWMETFLNDIEGIIMDSQDVDFNSLKKAQLNDYKKKIVKILKNIKAFDKQRNKILTLLDKLLNNVDKTKKMFDDSNTGEQLLGDMIDSLNEIKEEIRDGEYELPSEYEEKVMTIYNKLKEASPAAEETSETSKTEQSANPENTNLNEKIEALQGKEANVTNTIKEIDNLIREVGNKVQGTVFNYLKRNEDKLSIPANDIKDKLHNGENALTIIARTNYELLKEALEQKHYKEFNSQLTKLINDPYIEVKQSYQKSMKPSYGEDDLRVIEEAFKQYNPKQDFETILSLFNNDMEKAELPDPNAWRVTKFSKEAKIAMKIAKSFM